MDDATILKRAPDSAAAAALYRGSAELQAEFRDAGGENTFLAYVTALRSQSVRRFGSAVVTGSAPPAPKPGNAAVPATDEDAKAAYARSAELKAEFAAVGDYVAWAKAKRAGVVRVLGD